jgi:AraC-like DNA-binding protein
MDNFEGGILSSIPPSTFNLTLTRSAIRMQHSKIWRIEKENPVDDLLIALDGYVEYIIDGEHLRLSAGEALLIPRNTPFTGWCEYDGTFIGVAQHFNIEIYGRHDLLAQMNLKRKVALSRWSMLEPLVRHYRQSAPPSSISLAQHHLFMYFLICFIEDAFEGWRDAANYPPGGSDAMELAVMKAASQIAASPADPDIAETTIAAAPYNRDYFLREFQKRVGRTPRKYQELKRMERAMHLLDRGLSVAATGRELGYDDPYYFSRMFKRTLGLSPREHIRCMQFAREGKLMQLDEPQQAARLATRSAAIISDYRMREASASAGKT